MTERTPSSTTATLPELMRRLERAALVFGKGVGDGEKPSDPLALSIADVARHHGQRTTAAILVHGLPLVGGRLPVEHLELAARRAGLEAQIADDHLASLDDAELPVIALIADGSADVVWQLIRDEHGRAVSADVSEPGRAETRTRVAIGEYSEASSGRVVKLRPARPVQGSGEGQLPRAEPSWMLQAFSTSRKVYGEAILATLAINVLALALPLYTMNIYDRVLPNAASETLWALSLGVILAMAFDALIKTLRARFVDAAGRRGDVMLANFIFSRLLGARLAPGISTGARANTLREYETLREFFGSATLTAFGDLPFLILFLAMIAVVAGPLVLVPMAAFPIVLAIAWWTQRRVAALTENQFRDTAQKTAIAVEYIAGLETIKAAGAESFAATRWERAVADGIRTGNALRDASGLGMTAIFTAQSLIQVLMIVAGFYMVAAGNLTTGGLIAATMLAGRAMQPLGQVAALVARLHQARIAFRLLDGIVKAPQEREDGAALIAPEHIAGGIDFESVTLAYDKDSPLVLRELQLAIKPGEKVAIVGGIGSGKTSLLKLIHGLVAPTAGRVMIDGLPVGHIEPTLLRGAIGLAMQDAEVFQGTLRDNITMGDSSLSDAHVLKAAKTSLAMTWISRLPKGLDTAVRERGAGLSAGQKQSLTLARALAREPAILLLDEPSSAMDPASESQLVERLRADIGQRTLLVVTHRPAILDLVDRIVVLEGGLKVLDGPKASVLASLRARAAQTAQTGATPRSNA